MAIQPNLIVLTSLLLHEFSCTNDEIFLTKSIKFTLSDVQGNSCVTIAEVHGWP